MTRCSVCHMSKRASAYGYQKRGDRYSLRATCKACRSQTEAKRYKSLTPEQKEQQRAQALFKLYGVTVENYNDMFESQAGRCAGCCRHQSDLPKSLSVDHCHKTGKVRGLLCQGCNAAIGLVKESKETLTNLVIYLNERAAQ